MAKKKKAKPAKKAKAEKKAPAKRARKSKIDELELPDHIPSDPKIPVNEKVRDKMFSALARSTNEDLAKIIEVYGKADKQKKTLILRHYERNGSLFINCIFRGQLDQARSVASPEDKKLLEKVK